jgi:hypothetical protein
MVGVVILGSRVREVSCFGSRQAMHARGVWAILAMHTFPRHLLRLKRAASCPQGRVSATSDVTHDLASSQRKIYLSIYLSSHACQVASHGTHLSDPDRPQTNSGMLSNSVR